jgi:gas vesicle protein
MSDAKKGKKSAGRRHFLVGLLTGAGAAAALATAPKAAATKDPARESTTSDESILYRRTPESERYYRTLYR